MSEHCNKNTPKVLQVPCCDQPTLFHKVTIPASIGDEETNPPLPGKYRNTLLFYEANNTAYLYSSDGIPTLVSDMSEISRLEKMIEDEAATREDEDGKLAKAIDDEEDARKDADDEIWAEIETIEASSDVVDVVGTYAELQAYDTSKLHDKDLIKVLQDETRDDAITYYRWSTSTNTFTYVGAEGPYYTQSQTDTLLGGKQDTLIAGSNIQIAADGKTISATDTTYSNFVGTDGQTAGTSGLVPAPAAADDGKYLKADGTWDDISIPTVTLYSDFGQNTDGAMTQKAVTDGIYSDYTNGKIRIGNYGLTSSGARSIAIGSNGSSATGDYSVMVGNNGTQASGQYSIAIGSSGLLAAALGAIAIGYSSRASAWGSIAIGYGGATAGYDQSIALGGASITGRAYELSLGENASGQNPEKTRFIAHVTAGVNDTDAVNKKQLDDAIAGVTYSDFTGATSQEAGTSGLVPAPATTDVDKYLKGDGTWDAISIPTVTLYSGIGQNTDGAMTQKAVTDSLFANNDVSRIQIGGNGLGASVSNTIAIGSGGSSATKAYSTMIGTGGVTASGERSTAIGNQGIFASGFASTAIGSSGLNASGEGSVAIGYGGVTASHTQSIALGGASTTGRNYELSLGKNASGQSPETTRYIAHVTAGVNDTDAVNKKQLDDAIASIPAVNNISSGDWSALWQ